MTDEDCVYLRELVPEVVLGVGSATDRAKVSRHLRGCPACQREVGDASDDVDRLLLLAPMADPPPGFESRVLASVSAAAPPGPFGLGRRWTPSRWRPAVLSAVASFLVALAVVGGSDALLGRSTELGRGKVGSATTRMAAFEDEQGRQVGAALLVDGRRVYLSFTVNRAAAPAYRVMIDMRGAAVRQAGTAQVVGGVCTWAQMVDTRLADVSAVRLVPTRGGATYTSHLSAT